MEFDHTPAGRELDAVIAERCMGYRRWRVPRAAAVPMDYDGPRTEEPDSAHYALMTADGIRQYVSEADLASGWVRPVAEGEVVPPFSDALREVPRFSTDIAAAWSVVMATGRAGYTWSVQWKGNDRGYAETAEASCIKGFVEAIGHAFADTMPLAICRAALHALASQPRDPGPSAVAGSEYA